MALDTPSSSTACVDLSSLTRATAFSYVIPVVLNNIVRVDSRSFSSIITLLSLSKVFLEKNLNLNSLKILFLPKPLKLKICLGPFFSETSSSSEFKSFDTYSYVILKLSRTLLIFGFLDSSPVNFETTILLIILGRED